MEVSDLDLNLHYFVVAVGVYICNVKWTCSSGSFGYPPRCDLLLIIKGGVGVVLVNEDVLLLVVLFK